MKEEKNAKEKTGKKKGIAATVIGMVLIVGIILVAFLFLGRKEDSTPAPGEMEEVDSILSRNLSEDYPATPREVVRLYGRIMKCLFAESYSDEEFSKLSDMLRELYDEELLAKNPKEELELRLENEVKEYKDAYKEISHYVVESSSSAQTSRMEGQEYINLKVDFLIWEKGKYNKTYEEFTLRQAADGKWKILGWRQTEPFDLETDKMGNTTVKE